MKAVSDSLVVGGNVTGPAGTTNIASLGIIAAGIYELHVTCTVGAGAVAVDNGNMQLFANGVIVAAALPTNGADWVLPRFTANGTNSVLIRSVGAATAGVVYTATVTATRIY